MRRLLRGPVDDDDDEGSPEEGGGDRSRFDVVDMADNGGRGRLLSRRSW